MSASYQHILLTGPPGVGKTTIIQKVVQELQNRNLKIGGFYTEEVRASRERIGFDIVTLNGERGILARISASDSRNKPKIGKYAVNVSSFESLALPVFESSGLDLLVLDEIGKMELFSKTFLSEVKMAFLNSKSRILATIPVPKSPLPLVDDLRKQQYCTLIQVSKENRNELPTKLIQLIINL